MINWDKIEKLIKRHEGSVKNKADRHILYKCSAGKLTCGYGRNCEDNGFSEDEVELMLSNDIKYSIEMLRKIFYNFNDFTENRQTALISMMFNLGSKKFLLFRKMINAIKKDDWFEAAKEAADSAWHNQIGNRAIEIENLFRGD